MLSVNDMFMVNRPNIRRMFFGDVEQYLIENNIRYTENISFVGRSGCTHHYDFVIPGSTQYPEIRAINHRSKCSVESLLFSLEKTRTTRAVASKLFAFINDKDKKVNETV